MLRHAALLGLLLLPSLASAHGGLPISERILFQGDVMLVPTRYWGVFIGQEGGPWRWICEEAVNSLQTRVWALAPSGAFHVTDKIGITSSRDGGCTWISATGEIATRQTSTVIADPVEARRAWATTDAGTSTAPWNGLFTTTDDGLTWTAVLQRDEYLRGVAVSSDGMTIYVTGAPRTGVLPAPLLHVSKDRGMTWSDVTVDYRINGATPNRMAPLAVDPEDASVVFLIAPTDPARALVKGTLFGTVLVEQLQVNDLIGGMGFDGARHTATVATKVGLFRSTSGGPFVKVSNLSQAQCVTVHGATTYACSWNYPPDNAAIARSDDGGDTYRSIFQYDQTVGPVTESTCAPSTPVGQMCQAVWQMYATQLGIDPRADAGSGGSDGGAPPLLRPGCACDLGGRPRGDGPGAAAATVGLLLLVLLARRATSRNPDRQGGDASAP